MATCHIHPDRETGRSCTRCGRPACPDCLVDAAVGSHCLTCVRAAQPKVAERVKRGWKSDGLLVTKCVLALNVGIHLLSMRGARDPFSSSNRFVPDWSLFGPAVHDGEWYRMLTAGFLHLGLLHLVFNSLAIYQLGMTLERGIGRMRFLGIYLVSILAGSAGALLLSPFVASAGASGGAFGLMGAAVLGLRQRGVSFSNTGWGPVLIMNLLFTFGISGISIGGHLGGLVGGVGAAAIVLNPRRRHDRWYVDFAVLVGLAAVALAAGLFFAAHPRS